MKKQMTSSRRTFLKATTALGATMIGQPLILPGARANSSAANSRLNLALVGCGNQGRGVMKTMLGRDANIVAFCDPDRAMIDRARADAVEVGGESTRGARQYEDYRKLPDGLMIVGEKGCIHTSHWNTRGILRLEGEPRLRDVLRHEGTKHISETLPRGGGHAQEWLDACRGEGQTYSDFEIGGKLTEIVLAGVLAVRAGQSLDWDGENMKAANAPEASRFIHTEWRKQWLPR